MDYYFLFVQGLDIVAWLFILFSYYRKNTNKILVFQIIATSFFILHYYLLGAYSGVFICLLEEIRDYLYYKTDKDKYLFLGSIPFVIGIGMLSYHNLFDLFPIFSTLIDGCSLTYGKRVVLFGSIVSYSLWVIYDFCVLSYTGMITDFLVVLSNIGILLYEISKSLFSKKKCHKG